MRSFWARPGTLYFVGFVFPLLLSYVDFVWPVEGVRDDAQHLVIGSVLAFYLGLALPVFWGRAKPRPFHVKSDEGFFALVIGLWIVSFLCLVYEYYSLGGPPALSGDVETLRFQLQVNGYIHLLAVNTGTVSAIMFMAALHMQHGVKRMLLWGLGLIGLASLSLAGSRLYFAVPVVATLTYFYLSGVIRVNFRTLLTVTALLALLGVVKLLRESAHDPAYFDLIDSQLTGDFGQWGYYLYPLYMTFTYGFEILNRLVEMNVGGETRGYYTFYGVVSLLPGTQLSFGEFKNEVFGLDFYSGLTSTYLSNFYVDFGVKGAYVASFFLGLLSKSLYRWSVASPAGRFVYSFHAVNLLLLFYVFSYESFYSVWQLGLAAVTGFLLFKVLPLENERGSRQIE